MIDNFYVFLGCVIFACLMGLAALLVEYFKHDKK